MQVPRLALRHPGPLRFTLSCRDAGFCLLLPSRAPSHFGAMGVEASLFQRRSLLAVAILAGYSTQSAMKMLVSCSARPLRLEAHTSFFPSDENIGKASKPG